jgi:hypothetical protein
MTDPTVTTDPDEEQTVRAQTEKASGTSIAPSPPAATAPWYSKWGNASQMVSAVVAAIGFTVVIVQLNETRNKTADEAYRAELADARRNYASYSDAILRYPNLSAPNFQVLLRDHDDWLRYQAFVAHMLYAYDDILNVVEHSAEPGAKDEWLAAFNMDLEAHHRYLCQIDAKEPRFFKSYRPAIQERLKKSTGNCTAEERRALVEAAPETGRRRRRGRT